MNYLIEKNSSGWNYHLVKIYPPKGEIPVRRNSKEFKEKYHGRIENKSFLKKGDKLFV